MIELVIKIPEEKYKAITEMYETFPKDMKDWGLEAIKNGTPLPKNVTNRDVIKNIFGEYFSIPLATTNEWLDSPYERDESE